MIPFKIVLLFPYMCKKIINILSCTHWITTSKIFLDRLIIINDFLKKNLMLFRNLAKIVN